MTVELVDRCLSNMRKGKACGPDNLCAEHLLYAHPSLLTHLKQLYALILQHGFVPNSFGCGVSIPLIKDTRGSAIAEEPRDALRQLKSVSYTHLTLPTILRV